MQRGIAPLTRFALAIPALIITIITAFPGHLSASVPPPTQPAPAIDQDAFRRGKQIRALLLDALEQSYRDNGQWPDRLPQTGEGGLKLIYHKPKRSVISPDAGSIFRARSQAAATVVIYEPMKLHDEFKDKGLVITAVHDDSLDSIAQLDHKLKDIRNESWTGWHGRDLPFLVALDGGGSTRIRYTSSSAKGATTAAYGITSFPTTLAIGRDGRVIGEVSVRVPEGLREIEKLINSRDSAGH